MQISLSIPHRKFPIRTPTWRRHLRFPTVRKSPMARRQLSSFPGDIWTKSAATKTKLSGCLATVTRLIIYRWTRKMRQRFRSARKAAEKAFRMANLTPRDLHGADVHDCFSITEIVAYEILGLAEPGKGVDLVKSGATTLPAVRPEKSKAPFQIPVNAGGGLIGDGHPVGATGVRQVFEAYQQLTEQAGARQIENAKRFLTFNMGGSLTTSVAMLWGRG